MSQLIETLDEVEQGLVVRLALADGRSVDARVNQIDRAPDDHLRLELATDDSGDFDRYQVRAEVADGEWTPAELRRYDRDAEEWESLGEVTGVEPLEESRMLESEDETGHEG